jgi:hypothetical protein
MEKHKKLVEMDWTALGRTRIEVELEDEDRPVRPPSFTY